MLPSASSSQNSVLKLSQKTYLEEANYFDIKFLASSDSADLSGIGLITPLEVGASYNKSSGSLPVGTFPKEKFYVETICSRNFSFLPQI